MPPRRSPRNHPGPRVNTRKPKRQNLPMKRKLSPGDEGKDEGEDAARINVNLKLFSPTKAWQWDPRHVSTESSPNYTLTVASVWDIEEECRRDIIADRFENAEYESEDSSSDLESLIPDWEDLVDEYSDLEWLEVIEGKAIDQQNRLSAAEEIADCRAFLIRRDGIGNSFWDDMAEGEVGMVELAFELFDRFGRLQTQFKEHPVKRGSGVWGDELDDADILLIDELNVSPPYRLRGVGSKMLNAVLELASKKSREFLGVSWSGALQKGVFHRKTSSGNTANEKAIGTQLEHNALSFLRARKFRRIGSSRWMGYSPDEKHPSRSLPAEQDFNLPHPQRNPSIPEIDELIRAIPTTDDDECLRRLKDVFGDSSPENVKWEATDEDGNTILHLVPCTSKTQSTRWLMQKSPTLLSRLNADGNTPLEALEAEMERKRTIQKNMWTKQTHASDFFTGFDDRTISCLTLLKGLSLEQMSETEILRVKFGCTCGRCLGGFLSPRMRDELLGSAETTFDFLHTFGEDIDGKSWCSMNKDVFDYIPEPIARSLVTHKDSRTGFCMLWKHLATCLREKMLPTEENVLTVVRNAAEWPPHCRNFIQKGGAISSAATMLFKKTMESEELYDLMQAETGALNDLPTCRNDREIGMVSGMCGYERVNRVQEVTVRGERVRY